MQTTFQNPQTFQSRLTGKIINGICAQTDKFFELYHHVPTWFERKQELDYTYRDYADASTIRKTGWFFMLFILLPCLGAFDYSSINSFISYLAVSSGGAIGGLISFIGWAFFIFLELGIGFLLIHSKNNPSIRILAIALATVMIFLPSFLIYTGYAITENKTSILFLKTIALMIVSVLIHLLFFLLISEIWAGINYLVYCVKNWMLKTKDPHRNMKAVKDELTQLYPDFDRYVIRENPEQVAPLLHNRAWYLKGKLQKGNTNEDYILLDYNPDTVYTPLFIQHPLMLPSGSHNQLH